MSYKFMNSVGFGRVRRYLSQVIGGLSARAELSGLSGAFEELRRDLEALRALREAADDSVLVATARLRVDDAEWDSAIQRVSSRAYELANKKAANEPYVTLFGRVDARRARSLGAAKATIVGATVVKDGRRLDAGPDLSEVIDALEAATAALLGAKSAWDVADDALFQPRMDKKKFVGKLNVQIAIAEAGILTAFPGRGDLAAAVLTPWFERRRPKGVAVGDDGGDDVADLDEDEDDGDEPSAEG